MTGNLSFFLPLHWEQASKRFEHSFRKPSSTDLGRKYSGAAPL